MVSLPEEYARTLALLRKMKKASAIDLQAKFDPDGTLFKRTAFSVRLNRLRGMGLVKRHKSGLRWIYEVAG